MIFVARPLDQLSTRPDRSAAAPAAETSAAPIYFLADIDFDAGPVAVVLHGLATGAGPVMVTDQDVLRAAKDTAVYTDDPKAHNRLLLMSILFLSPPGTSMDGAFATAYQDGRKIRTYTCFKPHCETKGPDAGVASKTRDVAALLSASVPAERKTLRTDDHQEYLRQIAAIKANPTLIFQRGRTDPVEPAYAYPAHWRVYFPSQARLAAQADQTSPAEAFDPAARAAEYAAWLVRTLAPFAFVARAGPVEIASEPPPFSQEDAEGRSPVYAPGASDPLQFGLFEAWHFDAKVEGDIEVWRVMRDVLATGTGPAGAGDGPGMVEALNGYVTEAFGEPCDGCYFVSIGAFRNEARVGLYRPNNYILEWYAPQSDSADRAAE